MNLRICGCFKISFFALTEVGSEQNIIGYYKKQAEQQAIVVEEGIKKGNYSALLSN